MRINIKHIDTRNANKDGDMMKTIRALQEKRNISNIEMAELLEISASAYSDKRRGRRKFQPKEIVILCNFFDVSVNEVENFLAKDTRNAN